MTSVSSDGSVLTDRYTKGGRRLWYKLTVLQQPERARACGSGSKSANDRRPVDPPPVVELRIFEGATLEGSKDITFHYNASFFLFVQLEHARVIAHGRVAQAHADSQPPVLTGSPVSGMAYLDRPSEAGYFLFPDLSVRHEGNYRLVFQLYEQPKEKSDHDVDMDEKDVSDEPPFCHRADIKSNEFSVYSAKKFPGLAESTSLSRMVAEQGCRVRIRRDVRMRRRDGKPGGGDFDKPEDDYARNRRTSQTPEVPRDYFRARSGSATSDHRAPYPGEPQRRPSGVESYPPPPPPYVAAQPAPHSNLRFGDDAAPQFSPHYPPPHSAQPPPPSPTTPYHGSHQSPYGSAAPPPPPPQQSSQPSHYGSRSMSQSSYPASSPIKPEVTERRISAPYAPPSPAHALPSPAESKRPSIHSIQSLQSPSYPPPPSHHANPPPSSPYPPMNRPATAGGPNGHSGNHNSQAPTLPSLAALLTTPPSSGPRIEAAPLEVAPPEPRIGNKRGYDSTFYHNPRPLFNGSRPLDPHHSDPHPSDPRMQEMHPGNPLWYKRADGSWGQKQEAHYIQ